MKPARIRRPVLRAAPGRARGPKLHDGRQRGLRASRIIATLHRVSEAIENAVDPDLAAWAALVGLTAGEGLGLNRAFVLLVEGDQLRGWMAVGPRSRTEAAALWDEIRQHDLRPFERLDAPEREAIQNEREKHAELLERISHTIQGGCLPWRRAFVASRTHSHSCVRHWAETLESEALLVLPMSSGEGPLGVVLADNFVTRQPIPPAIVEAAQTLVHALRAALDRTRLATTLADEQRRRVEAERATALLEATRTLAHDLKNPLALAGGLARELLAAPLPPGEALGKRLAVIAAAIQRAEERLAELSQGLASQVSRVTVVQIDAAAVAERVAGSFRPLAESRRIRLQFHRPAEPVPAIAEPSLLERCVENLIGNGLNALREASIVAPTLRVAVFAKGEYVHVEIADNGPPLPAAMRDDPFSGLSGPSRAGTGLGLVSVRRLADAMGGTVEYDEREPGWVRFTVYLRRSP